MDLALTTILLLIISSAAEKCSTPNDEIGECKLLYTCPKLLDALNSKTEEAVNFVRNSTCGGTAQDPMVCCGSSETFNKTQPVKSRNLIDKKNLLPSRKVYGFQHSDDYFHTVNYTVINEFPWLALIKTRDVSKTDGIYKEDYRCSGAVINYRYVLTAAWCKTRTYFYPVSVRLGEYNIINNTDCILDGGVYECSSDVQEYGIEKYILLPYHDIGLIRLDSSVQFSDYVRPLCLPFPEVKTAVTGGTLKVNQWEFLRTLHGGDIKTSTEVQIIEKEQCKFYDMEAVICIGPNKKNEDGFCSPGNVGSPVVSSCKKHYQNQWQLEGIMVEISHCFPYDDRIPLLNVTYYLDWIVNNLEP